MNKLIVASLLSLFAMASAPAYAIRNGGGQVKTQRASSAQVAIAKRLKALTTDKNSPAFGLLKGTIKAKNVIIKGSLKGPSGPDFGPSARVTITDVEKRIAGGDRRSHELVKVTGTYLSETIAGPELVVKKVTPIQAPRIALE